MAPWEPLRGRIRGQSRRLLDAALTAASLPAKPHEPPVVAAYRKTRASTSRYPNSAELLRTVVDTSKLSGGIAEVCDTKYKVLADAWAGSRVVPVHSSWRDEVSPGGRLATPNDLGTPWLFSMDPMTYADNGDDCLRPPDLDSLSGALSRFVESDKPGIATLFVYAVRPATRPRFWAFANELASRIGACAHSYWVPHQGGNRNLAALLCTRIQPPSIRAPGIRVGRNLK